MDELGGGRRCRDSFGQCFLWAGLNTLITTDVSLPAVFLTGSERSLTLLKYRQNETVDDNWTVINDREAVLIGIKCSSGIAWVGDDD